jgi:uncharacterized protein (UPF0335 family)
VSRLTTGVGKMVDNAAVRAKRAEDAKKYYKELSDIAFQYEVWNATVDQRLEAMEKMSEEISAMMKELKEIGLELKGFHVKMMAEMIVLEERVSGFEGKTRS